MLMSVSLHVFIYLHMFIQLELLAYTVTIFKKLPNLSTVAVLYPIPIRTV